MHRLIEEYLVDLQWELHDVDPAIVEEALAEAKAHLNQALAHARMVNPGRNDAALARQVIDAFGQAEKSRAPIDMMIMQSPTRLAGTR